MSESTHFLRLIKSDIIKVSNAAGDKKMDGTIPMIFFNLVESQSGLIQPLEVTVIEQA